MPNPYITPVAKSVPFDNATNGFTSQDVQAAIEEVRQFTEITASPGFGFGKSGSVSNAWLLNETVPSNQAGRLVPVNDGKIVALTVTCRNNATCTFTVYKRSGASFVALTTISLSSQRVKAQIVDVSVAYLDEIAVKVTSGSVLDPVFGIFIKGRSAV